MNALRKVLLTGLGTGYLPIAPGTWGSAAACGLFTLLLWACGPNSWVLSAVMISVVIVGTVGCVAWGDFLEKAFGRSDPRQCTLDEWAGQAIALIYLPLGAGWIDHAWTIGVAFLAFRLFDILKPPPARQAERLSKGFGVVSDDLVAGVYANIASQLVLRLAVGLS